MRWFVQLFVLISLCLLVTPEHSFANTYAYFIGPEGKIAKLNTDTNAVTQLNLKTSAGVALDKILDADTANFNLYINHCVRLSSCKLGVYGLKTLSFIKELPLESLDPNVQMIIYPDGSKFLIQYFIPGEEGEEGGYTTDLYNGKTLTKIQNLRTIFGMEEVMFSLNGKKIYSVIGGDEARIDTIDSTTFKVLASKDLTQLWRKDVFRARVENFEKGKLLISENLKTEINLPDKLDFYVYDIETGGTSPKISTGLQGNLVLTPDGTKIIFDENQDIRETIAGESRFIGFKSLGRLHIYDVATGNKIKTISFNAKETGKVIGIRPAGDRLYYQSKGLTEDTYNITVINIKNYYVMTTSSLPFKVLFVVFFEE